MEVFGASLFNADHIPQSTPLSPHCRVCVLLDKYPLEWFPYVVLEALCAADDRVPLFPLGHGDEDGSAAARVCTFPGKLKKQDSGKILRHSRDPGNSREIVFTFAEVERNSQN